MAQLRPGIEYHFHNGVPDRSFARGVGRIITFQDHRLRGPARALLVIEKRVRSDVVTLALGHGQ